VKSYSISIEVVDSAVSTLKTSYTLLVEIQSDSASEDIADTITESMEGDHKNDPLDVRIESISNNGEITLKMS